MNVDKEYSVVFGYDDGRESINGKVSWPNRGHLWISNPRHALQIAEGLIRQAQIKMANPDGQDIGISLQGKATLEKEEE